MSQNVTMEVTVRNWFQMPPWRCLFCGPIPISLGIEPEDLELSPFNQRGGPGKAHELFGGQLARLLDELNEVLAA